MVEVHVDTSTLFRQVNESRDFQAYLGWKMEPVLAEAKRTAPDAPPIGKGYVEGLFLWFGTVNGQARARVCASDFKSLWVEYGAKAGGRTAVLKYRTLGRALPKVRKR